MRLVRALVLLFAASAAAGCDEKIAADAPAPREISADSIGHYCGMSLPEHGGPKGQIFLASRKDPVWFSSIHDTLAFTMLPEEPKDIVAIYVSDMEKASNWEAPEPGTWIRAKEAWFVIDSGRKGGMGGNELVPFGTEAAAHGFAAKEGGRVVRLDQVPRDYVLTEGPAPARHGQPAHSGHAPGPSGNAGGHGSHGQ
jgi:copper chaperone NosL